MLSLDKSLRCRLLACFLWAFLLIPSGCSKKANHEPMVTKNEVVSTTTQLAAIADNEQPYANKASAGESAVSDADQKTDMFHVMFNPYGKAVAYLASVGDQAHVVYNGKPGKSHQGAKFVALEISPDGQSIFYGYKIDEKSYAVLDGMQTGPFDEIGPPTFSPDSRHIAYEIRRGTTWYIICDSLTSQPAHSYYEKPVFSADSSKIMFIENTNEELKKRVVISSTKFKQLAAFPAIAQPIALSATKSRVAVVNEKDGKKLVLDISIDNPGEVKEGRLYDSVRHMAYNRDGSSLTYVATKGLESYLVLDGKEERLPAGDLPWPPVIRPGNQGAGIVISGKDGAYLHQAFIKNGIKIKHFKEIAELVYSKDGKQQAHGAIKNEKFMAVVNGVEGPLFDRVFMPEFSPDGAYLVYRARQDNKRFIVVADAKGTIIRQHPGYERVFDPVFTEDGKSVAYGVLDGRKLIWKVEKL